MRKFYPLFILVFIAFSACDDFNDPESPYIEQYVVFGNISGNMSMIDDTIFVSRSASLDEKVEANQLWISDADITISGDGNSYTAFPVLGQPGRYQTEQSVVFKAGQNYKLSVLVNGKTLTSETTVPKSLNINSETDLKNYICNDGTSLPVKAINTDNMNSNGEPIPSKVDTLEYNYGQCFTGSFASYPMFALDFEIDESSKLVRTLTYGLETETLGLEPGTDRDYYDYNWNGKRDSTYINLIYDTSFVNILWKGPYLRDAKNNPSRENPFVWSVEKGPIRMSWLYFNYYGLQLITVQATDMNFYDYLQGDPLENNIYTLPGSNISGGYGLFSSHTYKSFYVYLKRGRDFR